MCVVYPQIVFVFLFVFCFVTIAMLLLDFRMYNAVTCISSFVVCHFDDPHSLLFVGFMYNEFIGQTFVCDVSDDGQCLCTFPDINQNCLLEGEEILAYYGYDSPDDKWYWIAVLIGMALFYRLLFYLFLRFLNKGMRK
jgi:Plant PDR ABC transporter associated